ncbi:MAG: formate dehydrogenase accessory sulfurtransferase FdhD [Flavobacteriaceae bacterium]|nr:formate dehydrogenase accessory sulfurtransferase FdhD [Flavobacteriaceae bacterium]
MVNRNYEAIKIDGALSVVLEEDALPIEEAIQIIINQKPFTIAMCTPGDKEALVRGLLHAEDVIDDASYSPIIRFEKEDNSIIAIAHLDILPEKLGDGYQTSRSLLSVSSCGICGKTELEKHCIEDKVFSQRKKLAINLIPNLFKKMHTLQDSFKRTGGTHAAAAFDLDGNLLVAKEDIGRHNAVDKVVGQLLLDKKLSSAKVLTVSGRISYEIVIKCFKAQIPYLAAVSAPSSLAVDYAKEFGVTLLAFCRDNRATCYANAQHLI